jgi:hypothetical protein
MCPLCIATAALIAASTISTGGAIALVVPKLFRAKDGGKEMISELKSKEKSS